MKRDDIYDHLAQVYIGKTQTPEQENKKKKEFGVWLVINILITLVVFSSAVYGLTAFLTHRGSPFENHIIYDLSNGPVRLDYNFKENVNPTKSFKFVIDGVEASKYSALNFSIRAKEEGNPDVIKIILRNQLNEESVHYLQGIKNSWESFEVSFEKFNEITDWTSLKDITFVLESWNVEDKKGLIIIDDVYFSNSGQAQTS